MILFEFQLREFADLIMMATLHTMGTEYEEVPKEHQAAIDEAVKAFTANYRQGLVESGVTVNRAWISNYREFRRTFEDDQEAKHVEAQLKEEIQRNLRENLGIQESYAASYDSENFACFDTVSAKFYFGKVDVTVVFTSTAG